MHKTIQRALSLFTFLCTTAMACSAELEPSTATGELSLPLRSDLNGATYELRDATFSVIGESQLTLATGADTAISSLEAELPTGDYSITLAPDWRLFRLDPDGERELPAVLVSGNPLVFSIVEAETTSVSFRFEVDGEEIDLTTGLLELTIDVVNKQSKALLFTEFMSNPAVLGDADGEWLELYNAGSEVVELQGCSIERDASAFTVNSPLSIAPGAFATFANGDSPGFTPSYVYSGVTLPNSAVFVLTLRCEGEPIDSITVDPSSWPGTSGVAASLSANQLNHVDNDMPSAWCDAASSYNGDLGTPGGPNPICATAP